MIAALAAGLLGQIEGSKAVANGLSGLLGGAPRATPQSGASPQQGRTPALHRLSDSVQATLLQMQSTNQVQTDDVGDAMAGVG